VFADDLVLGVPFDALRALIPTGDAALGVEQENSVSFTEWTMSRNSSKSPLEVGRAVLAGVDPSKPAMLLSDAVLRY